MHKRCFHKIRKTFSDAQTNFAILGNIDDFCRMKVMIEDREGMMSHYLRHYFGDCELLSAESAAHPDLVVACACRNLPEAEAVDTNMAVMERLLNSLEDRVPSRFVYISSSEVYAPDSGEDIEEDHPAWAVGKTGQACALCEGRVREWCAGRGVRLTLLRPATMLGCGMGGWIEEFFRDVVSGRYIHVRGNDARISLVMALDVAEAVWRLNGVGGLYNLSDGRSYTYIDIADAMTANAGAMKRMTHLPGKWADVAWRIARFIPAVSASLSPAIRERRSKTLTLGNARALAAGCRFHDVAAVMRREDKDYPYEDK